MTENSSRLQQQMAFIKEIDKEKLIGRQTYISDASLKKNLLEGRPIYLMASERKMMRSMHGIWH